MRSFLVFCLFLWPLGLRAAPPDLTSWLYQHPEVSGKIVWEFPDTIPELPATAQVKPRSLSGWLNTASRSAPVLSNRPTLEAAEGISTSPSSCAGASCPIPQDLDSSPGKVLQWYYWPLEYKDRLQAYFRNYWAWMETSAALYRQFQQGGYSQKPAGFEERFGTKLDPETGAPAVPLPFAAQVFKDQYTHVLYDPAATVDLFLKNIALQLVLELGDFVPWKFADYKAEDLSVLLDGRYLFRYFPAGSHPWTGSQTVDKEGYDADGILSTAPLATMSFLLNEGLVRETRFETVSQFLEWQRSRLEHTMGNQQSLVGECGKEYGEVYWGVKGAKLVSHLAFGTVMACPLVPQPNSDYPSTVYSPNLKHYTGGCGATGYFIHRVLRLANIPAEPVAFTHGQARFVVERAPYEQMMGALEPALPAEPAINDGLPVYSGSVKAIPQSSALSASSSSSRTAAPKKYVQASTALVDVYLDHNDNSYGMKSMPEVPVREALVSQDTYRRWFKPPPEHLSSEQRTTYMSAHNKRVSLRPLQLRIARMPLHTADYFCWKEDAGKPYAETQTYRQFFEGTYTPEELAATGFWQRLEQQIVSLGGCEAI